MIDEKIYEQLKNNKIKELELFDNKIENIDKLSESLKFNSSLKELHLNLNKIKREDIIKLEEKYKNINIYF